MKDALRAGVAPALGQALHRMSWSAFGAFVLLFVAEICCDREGGDCDTNPRNLPSSSRAKPSVLRTRTGYTESHVTPAAAVRRSRVSHDQETCDDTHIQAEPVPGHTLRCFHQSAPVTCRSQLASSLQQSARVKDSRELVLQGDLDEQPKYALGGYIRRQRCQERTA